MKKIFALVAATLTITLSTGASATTATIAQVPNNSLATGALGRAVSQYSCDDPFVAPICARVTLFSNESASTTPSLRRFTSPRSRSNSDEQARIGAVIDRGNLYVFEDRSPLVSSFLSQPTTDVTSPPNFEGEDVLEQPLPAAAPLLFAGLAVIGFLTRRRRDA